MNIRKILLIGFISLLTLSGYSKTTQDNEKTKFKSCTPGVYLNKSVKVYGKVFSNCKFGEVTHITPDGRLIDQILCFVPMSEMDKYVDIYASLKNNLKYKDEYTKKHKKYCQGDALEIAK